VGAAIAELTNSSAVTQVAMVNANTIRWTRQGGAAELDWVKAELIPQSGAPVSLGLAQRVSGGWEITSPTPVSNATVRLYGPATHATGMITMVKEILEVGIVTPQLVATRNQQPLSTTVANDLGNRQGGIGTIELIR